MLPTHRGSLRLFRFAGISVFVHWSWLILAAYALQYRTRDYSSPLWNVLELVAVFVIVTMHEFGHALACRSVGGQADQIVLWPLGGVAYVAPPQRPGATLWSIAAGPLVNVALVPILALAVQWTGSWEGTAWLRDASRFIQTLWWINIGLLFFNLLPVYPLDGGQIVRSLLWFVVGRAHSLMAASVIGFVGVAGLFGLAWLEHDAWLGIVSVFVLMMCWNGLTQARALARRDRAPRHAGFACPACRMAPIIGAYWVCGRCRQPFDTFATGAVCPHCGAQYDVTTCLDCGEARPMSQWIVEAPVPPNLGPG